MKSNILIIACMIFFLSLVFLVSAQINNEIDVNINVKDVFYTGEIVKFDYTITSLGYDGVVNYIPSISCNKSYQLLLNRFNVSLKSGESYSSNYNYGIVDENVFSEICTATVFIHCSEGEKTFSKDFEIIAEEALTIDVFFCKDENCREKSKVFMIGENIYIDYSSNVNSEVKGLLKIFDGSFENIVLPYTFVPDKEGSYLLKVTSFKQGYKNFERDYEFGVLVSKSNIQKEDFSAIKEKSELEDKESNENIKDDSDKKNYKFYDIHVTNNFYKICLVCLLIIWVVLFFILIILILKYFNRKKEGIQEIRFKL